MRVSEKRLRRIVREAHYMTDEDLIRESILLQEFLGSILKAITSPFRGLMNIYKKGLLNTIGKKGEVMLRNVFGTQKDVDRSNMISAEAERAQEIEDQTDAEAMGSLDEPAQEVMDELVALSKERVFPTFGRIDQPTGPEKDRADKEFKKEAAEIVKKCEDLTAAGARFRGTVKALVKHGALAGVEVPENVIDLSFPLSYVSSLGALATEVKSKSPEGSVPPSLEKMIEVCKAWVEAKSSSLSRLTDRIEGDDDKDRRYNEAATRIVVYGNVLNERKRTRGRVI
jgi:hypothetical protein